MEGIRELKDNEAYLVFDQWFSEINFFGIADSKEGIQNIIKRMNKEIGGLINDSQSEEDEFFIVVKDNETDEKETIIVKILNKNC